MTLHTKFKFYPASVLSRLASGSSMAYPYLGLSQQFAAYQWFCQRLAMSGFKDNELSILNGNPGTINNTAFDPMKTGKEPYRRLGILFSNVSRSTLLKSIGINSWADLAKPMILTVPNYSNFPDPRWFEMRNREFYKSENEYHPKAIWVMGADLTLSPRAAALWALNIEYGYRHDSSHWFHTIRQREGEKLDAFTVRVNAEIGELLLPDCIQRKRLEQDWQRVHSGLTSCMCEPRWNKLGWEKELADLLCNANRPHNSITLDNERIETLKSWIANPISNLPVKEAK